MARAIKDSRKESREEELLQRAIELFSRGGFRETSLQDIADELGITRPLVYYYFESKEDMLWRIIGHLGDSLLEQARPIAESDESPTERLRHILERHVETLLTNSDAFRIYLAERHQLKGKRDLRLKRGEVRYHDLIVDIVAEGQASDEVRDGDPHMLTRLAVGTANSLLSWYKPTGRASLEEATTLSVDVILAGLAPDRQPT